MRRRTILATGGGLLSGGMAGCLSSSRHGSRNTTEEEPFTDGTIPAGTWPQIGFDSQHTRHSPDARGPRDDATITWQSLGDRPVYPPVVDDALYCTEG
jgi:hypothetical protein